MKESLFIVFGLVIGFVLLRTYLFSPPQKNNRGLERDMKREKKKEMPDNKVYTRTGDDGTTSLFSW